MQSYEKKRTPYRMFKTDLGLLLLRVSFGSMMLFSHGWGKLTGFSEYAAKFPDPFGAGPTVSLALAVFAEVFCAAAVVLGAATKFAVIPLMITMAVAFFMIHGADPWGKKELAFAFFSAYTTVLLLGPGRFSVDGAMGKLRH